MWNQKVFSHTSPSKFTNPSHLSSPSNHSFPQILQLSNHPSIQSGDGGMRGAFESAGPLRGRRGVLDKTHEPFREPFSFSYRLRAFRRSSPWTPSRPPWTAWWPPWTGSRPTFFDPDFRPIFGRRFLSILNDFCLPFGLQNRPEIA